MLLLGSGIPKEVESLPQDFLRTQYGMQVAPLLQQMVENLALNSNSLFTEEEVEALHVKVPG
jgi:hypothetical protein